MQLSESKQIPPAAAWIDLIPAVYRYLLAWTGSTDAAQRLAEQTLALAGRWPQNSEDPASTAAWLLGLARYARTFPRKRRGARDACAEYTVRPDQAELAMVAQLATQLARLPVRAAEALALTVFAGLGPGEAAAVLGVRTEAVPRLIQRGLEGLQRQQGSAERHADQASGKGLDDLAEALGELASMIAPERGWLERAEQSAAAMAADAPRRVPRGFPGPGGRRLFALRRARGLASWMAPALLLLCMAVYVLFIPQSYRPTNPPTAVPTPAVDFSSHVINNPTAGWLVPPDANFCTDEQDKLAAVMGMPASLKDEIIYSDPKKPSTDPLGKGLGCRIEITGTGKDFPDIDQALQKVKALLSTQDFAAQDTFSCENCVPGNYLFDEYTVGKGMTLAQTAGDMQAILSLAWRPPGPTLCPSVSDISNPCPTPTLPQRLFALRLTLASSAPQAAVQRFLDEWASGDRRARDGLYIDFRQYVPDLAALDRLAGIQHSAATVPQLTATVLENSGARLRVEVQGLLNSRLALPSKAISPFQMEVEIGPKGWQVTDISTHTLFPPSLDDLYWANADGQVMRYSLLNGTSEALTGPHTYDPANAASETLNRDPAQVSPDGAWLSLVQPVTGKMKPATLFIYLQTPRSSVRMPNVLPYAVRLAWSTAGEKVAFFRLDDPRTLYTWEAPFTGEPAALARFDQDLESLAWSQDGKRIAVLVDHPVEPATPSKSSGPQALSLGSLEVVTAADGTVREVAVVPASKSEASALDLTWQQYDREIWVRPALDAVDVASGRQYPLAFPIQAQDSPLIHYSLFDPPVGSPGNWRVAVSPSLRWIAFDPNYGGANQGWNNVIVQPAGEPGKSLWQAISLTYQSLGWTREGQNLIAAGETNRPGIVTRIGALAGQSAAVVQNVYWIGIGSQLQALSLNHVLENKTHLLPAPDLGADWPCQNLGKYVPCIPLPPDWSVALFGPQSEYPTLIATNVVYANPYGWAREDDGSIILQCYTQPASSVKLDQIAPPDQKGVTWEEVTIGGRKAIHKLVQRALPGAADALYFSIPNGWLSIYIEPPSAYTDSAVQKVIKTIRFAPEE
jgi:DNA-directed RNA polymerase specialized sigma24 family protein